MRNPRYVKLVGAEPGHRFDLIRGKSIYSSRFLAAEEHLLDGRVAEAWSTLWCWVIATPRVIRRKVCPFVWNALACFGLAYTLAIILDWYLHTRGQR